MSRIKIVNFTYTRRDGVYTAVRISKEEALQRGLGTEGRNGDKVTVDGVFYRRLAEGDGKYAWFRTTEVETPEIEGTAP
ncbi:hypothetical protein [Chitinivorax sp. B]|uniref:hypothetical protein n=1 Tax=Chitinivorax sp. B TaxID=2502235 RepID=UPI0010F874D6|nr:hypothetical protein [Chitinivorax sp. B]